MVERGRVVNSLLISTLLTAATVSPIRAEDSDVHVRLTPCTEETGVIEGVAPKWPSEGEIIFESNIYASGQDEAPEAYRDAITEAAADWNEVGFGPRILYARDTTDAADPKLDGKNQIIFMDRGAHERAISTVVYHVNGVIKEVDIRVNRKLNWSAGDRTGSAEIDFGSAILHEFGHAYYLDHSSDPQAVMYSKLSAGEVKDELTEGDIEQLRIKYGT